MARPTNKVLVLPNEQLEAEATRRNHRAFLRAGKLPSRYWVVAAGGKKLISVRRLPKAEAGR
jgi:hypothetical protein